MNRRQRIIKLTQHYKQFFAMEQAGGIVLLIATIASLVLSNTSLSEEYLSFWQKDLGGHSLSHWINDGLMAIFFLMIGLELERELYTGELSNPKNALLPIIAAIGGMLVPAGIYFVLNYDSEFSHGFGIPMATDIAFAIGILSLFGSRIPPALKIFLTALAVIDDLGAILVIAIFYTDTIALNYLVGAIAIWLVLMALNKHGVKWLAIYLVGGVVMWWLMLQSGIHATIAGVLLAFAIPFYGNEQYVSPSHKMEHILHYPVSFVILPLFALSNTTLVFSGESIPSLLSASSLGIILGLSLGKPIGILLFTWISVKMKFVRRPIGLSWKGLIGVGMLAGIGFTMSIFITQLAFSDAIVQDNAKLAILIGSLISGLSGSLFLYFSLPSRKKEIYLLR
ncbi:MAG: Na+/H+ antiporter NhaA [Paludibacteraceae bacterium]|nr:Na+/H+ antiporter NhaA [Paludibacteraceae bacterium]